MRKRFTLVITLFLLALTSGLLKAEEDDLILSDGETDITIDTIDPYSIDSEGLTYETVDDESVLYTAAFPDVTIEDESRVFFVLDSDLNVQAVASDAVDIPLNAVVLSLDTSRYSATTFDLDEPLSLSDPSRIAFYSRAIESESGKRAVIDDVNEERTLDSTVYYDARYGDSTKTSRMGTEMIVQNTGGSYVVDSFRPLVSGTEEGSVIPDNGFVISAAGSPDIYRLMEGILFNEGDAITYMDKHMFESETHTHAVDAMDPTSDSNPDGEGGLALRGQDQMIVYTDNWRLKDDKGYTGTNEHGYEISVSEDGEVVDMDTNTSIPEGGMVLSGHGEAADFLRHHVRYGSKIELDGDLNVINTGYSIAIASAKGLYDRMSELYESRMDGLYDVDRTNAEKLMDALKDAYSHLEALEQTIASNAQEDKEAIEAATEISQHHAHMAGLEDDLHYALSVSHTIDARAMWHRPNEQTLAEIQSNLDLWESLGFNMIYVETLWSGYSSYPSELLDTHPDVSGNRYGDHGDDYLKAFIEEAHSRGIEVHAWNSIFFLGSERRPLSNVLTDNPDWRMVNHDGTRIQNSTIFGDPANLDLRNYLVRFHEEMFTNYDLDGMQFDYIRYPYLSDVDHPGTRTDSGYTETAMNRFKEEYDIEGDIKTLVEEDEEVFQKFIEFRKNQVTESLKAIRDAVFEINPEAEFSMAVVPEPDKAVREYYQEWPLWIENGYIDHIAPMVYHGDPDIVADKASIIQDIAHPLAFQYTGIAPVYFGYTPFDNQMQINEVHAIGAFGYAIFATHNVNGNRVHEEALQKSSNRDKALLPHSDMELLIQAFVDKQKDKINNLYAPNDQMKDSEELRRMLDELLTENPLSNAAEYMEVYNQLKVLKSYAPVLLETPAADRLTEDTERMMNLVDVKISRDLIQRELWHPENDSERPDPLALDYPDSNPDDDEPNDESEDSERQISKWSIPIMVASGALIAVLLGLFYKLKIRTP